jgi:hypothetical protein
MKVGSATNGIARMMNTLFRLNHSKKSAGLKTPPVASQDHSDGEHDARKHGGA